MADAATILQLHMLRRQYFQLVEPHQLTWPEAATLKSTPVQAWLFGNMFDPEQIKSPPPDRYQLRVLKLLISKLERAIENPEEDVRPPISSLWNYNVIDIAKICHRSSCRIGPVCFHTDI
jgi:hypothetical protein